MARQYPSGPHVGHTILAIWELREISLRKQLHCDHRISNFGLNSTFHHLHVPPSSCLIAWEGSTKTKLTAVWQLAVTLLTELVTKPQIWPYSTLLISVWTLDWSKMKWKWNKTQYTRPLYWKIPHGYGFWPFCLSISSIPLNDCQQIFIVNNTDYERMQGDLSVFTECSILTTMGNGRKCSCSPCNTGMCKYRDVVLRPGIWQTRFGLVNPVSLFFTDYNLFIVLYYVLIFYLTM